MEQSRGSPWIREGAECIESYGDIRSLCEIVCHLQQICFHTRAQICAYVIPERRSTEDREQTGFIETSTSAARGVKVCARVKEALPNRRRSAICKGSP